MDLAKLAAVQRAFDAAHGWLPAEADKTSLLQFLRSDVIGLCGEVGEVAGIVKTLGLLPNTCLQDALRDRMPELHEELIDVLIYLVRMLDYLNVDVEAVYLEKLKKNEERFRRYEQ